MGEPEVRTTERRRESPAGMHFYGLYRECPRKWYLKYVIGLRPTTTGNALLLGGAIHEALEVYYGAFSLAQAQQAFRDSLADRRSQYSDLTKFTEDFNRGPTMLQTFHERVGQFEARDYEVIELEQEYQIPVGPEEASFRFTVRPDKVVRRRSSGVIYPVEVKTTSYSLQAAASAADRSDQVTGYLWAVGKVHPEWEVGGCLLDIIYNKKSVFEAERRPTPSMRSRFELATFEMGLYGTIVEVTQKYQSLESYPWPLIFPQYRSACSHWGCEYQGICFTNLKSDEVPPGFTKDPWKQEMSEVFQKTQNFKLEGVRYTT